MKEEILPPPSDQQYPKTLITVYPDGTAEIGIPKEPSECLAALRLIYNALLEHIRALPARESSIAILSEHFAHLDFESKLINKMSHEILHKHHPVL